MFSAMASPSWVGVLGHSGQAAVRHEVCPTSGEVGCRVPSDGDIIPRTFENPTSREKLLWQWKLPVYALEWGVGTRMIGQML